MQKVPPKNQVGVARDLALFAVVVVPDEKFLEDEK